ncbi:hypothetical protein B0813_001123 [Candidatus Fervidibacteria bacterium JGI MDM2 SSWTFF-3-K9]
MTSVEQRKTGGGLARRIARNMLSRSARHFVSALALSVLKGVCYWTRSGHSWR